MVTNNLVPGSSRNFHWKELLFPKIPGSCRRNLGWGLLGHMLPFCSMLPGGGVDYANWLDLGHLSPWAKRLGLFLAHQSIMRKKGCVSLLLRDVCSVDKTQAVSSNSFLPPSSFVTHPLVSILKTSSLVYKVPSSLWRWLPHWTLHKQLGKVAGSCWLWLVTICSFFSVQSAPTTPLTFLPLSHQWPGNCLLSQAWGLSWPRYFILWSSFKGNLENQTSSHTQSYAVGSPDWAPQHLLMEVLCVGGVGGVPEAPLLPDYCYECWKEGVILQWYSHREVAHNAINNNPPMLMQTVLINSVSHTHPEKTWEEDGDLLGRKRVSV